jgi:serpin B
MMPTHARNSVPLVLSGLVLASLASTAPIAGQEPTTEPRPSVARHVNRLGATLLDELFAASDAEAQNACISPYSVHSALTLVFPGARGETREELARLLGLSADLDGREALAPLAKLAEELEPPRVRVGRETTEPAWYQEFANSAFGQEGYDLEAPYVRQLEQVLGAHFETIDFSDSAAAAERIDGWISKITRGHIHDLVTPDALSKDTRLLLVNALWLRAPWDDSFHEGGTRREPFHRRSASGERETIHVAMMHRQGNYAFAERDGTRLVIVPCDSGELGLVVVLPAEGESLATLRTSLGADAFDDLVDQARAQTLDLGLPRFRIDPKAYELTSALRASGLEITLDATRADFSGITSEEQLSIDAVLHAARIEVDEKGTEAAAATVIAERGGAKPGTGSIRTITFDRPFLFALRHLPTGCNLFLGQVADPQHLGPIKGDG